MHFHQHPFFDGVNRAEVDALAALSTTRTFAPGDIIFDEGADSDSFGLILSGRVRFEKRAQADVRKFHIVGEADSGDAFGELGAMLGASRFLRVSAAAPTRIAFLPARALRGVWDHLPPLARRMADMIVRHLCDTTARYAEDAASQERLVTLGTMVSSVSHDLRTPLTLINLNSQLIETVSSTADPMLTALLTKHCRNIEAQVERMMGMLEEVADFTHGRAGDDYTRIDLLELFETFRFLNSPYWESAGVAVDFRGEKAVVEAEPRKLLRVLQNLVGNAVDAMEGRPDARIVLEAGPLDADTAFLRVSDNGPGIPEKIRSNFWEPFVTSGKARGTGLGTAICRTLVESHGGRITFQTETDKGTRFDITLPVKRPARQVTASAPALLRSAAR